jgi:hypothetical protein
MSFYCGAPFIFLLYLLQTFFASTEPEADCQKSPFIWKKTHGQACQAIHACSQFLEKGGVA